MLSSSPFLQVLVIFALLNNGQYGFFENKVDRERHGRYFAQ